MPDEAPKKAGVTLRLVMAMCGAVPGMFLFGYNIGVMNAPQEFLEKFIREVREEKGIAVSDDNKGSWVFPLAVSIFAIGGMVGGVSGGIIANRFGRKGGMLMNLVLGVISGTCMGLTRSLNSIELLIIGRLLAGVHCGLSTGLVPTYLIEIAPVAMRGAAGTLNQLGVTFGIFTSGLLGLPQLLGTEERWQDLFVIAVIPPLVQLVLLPVSPESPRFLLITRQQETEARKALQILRKSTDVENEIDEMKEEDKSAKDEPAVSMLQVLKGKEYRLPLVIGLMMHLSQQFSGINAVFFYAVGILKAAGVPDDVAKYSNLGVGGIMVSMTLVSIPLMDRAGRRTLHLCGLGGMFIFSIIFTISLLTKENFGQWAATISVVSMLLYVMFFAIGPGTIPWMLMAELFAQGPRSAAMSIGVLVNWIASFAVSFIYPPMQGLLQDYSFVPFTILLAIFWLFTYKKLPETKNKTFEEIAALFRGATTPEQPPPPPPAGNEPNEPPGAATPPESPKQEEPPPPPPPAPEESTKRVRKAKSKESARSESSKSKEDHSVHKKKHSIA